MPCSCSYLRPVIGQNIGTKFTTTTGHWLRHAQNNLAKPAETPDDSPDPK